MKLSRVALWIPAFVIALAGALPAGPARGESPPIDAVFLVATQDSLRASELRAEADFAANELTKLAVSPGGDHAAVIQYADKPAVAYSFAKPQAQADIVSAIRQIRTLKGVNRARDAVEAALAELTSHAHDGARRELILLTSSSPFPADAQSPCPLRAKLDAAAVHVTVVLMGPNADKGTYACLTSSPKDLRYAANGAFALR